jgi:hypothetical protein
MKRLIIALALLFSTSVFADAIQSLNQSQVNQALKDKTITTIPLATINGSLVNNTFSGYFNANGKVIGQMAHTPASGPANDTGSWTVTENGSLCVTWDHWNNKQNTCIALYNVNNGLLFINQNTHKLETMVLNENIKNGNGLN